jgi:soluble P-type ATPase
VPERELVIEVPGSRSLRLRHVILDFNGTLAGDGKLLPGVRPRLLRLARKLSVAVLTADTFGTARGALRGLPVAIETVKTGIEKRRFVTARMGVVAIGNGRNDFGMMEASSLGILIVGPEGAAADALQVADVVVRDVRDALDLLLRPKRIIATLRR